MKKVLVTGGAGFIGSHFCSLITDQNKLHVVDKLTYAGDLSRLDLIRDKIGFDQVDICDVKKLKDVFEKVQPEIVVHFAAETHVDRSLANSDPFFETNIRGTQNLVDLSKKFQVEKFIHISTDEVYGSGDAKYLFKETDVFNPSNPYAQTKAKAEKIVRESIERDGLSAMIIRPCNNYGRGQHLEKFIPTVIRQALENKKIPVYGKGQQRREWINAQDCVQAIQLILEKGKFGEIYNIGTSFEQDNLTTVKEILKIMQKSDNLIEFVDDREKHDFCYGVNWEKLKNLGWKPKVSFEEGIRFILNQKFDERGIR